VAKKKSLKTNTDRGRLKFFKEKSVQNAFLLKKCIVPAVSDAEKTQGHVAVDSGHNVGSRFENGDRVSPEFPGLGQSSI
jgi:hypothetical protein